MKSALIAICFLSLAPCVLAQKTDCDYYIHSANKHSKQKTRQSQYPLQFSITESIEVKLVFSDRGSSNTLELSLDFDNTSGLPVEPGSTLKISFVDGSDYSVIARTKKPRAGIIYFTLLTSNLGLPLSPGEKEFITKLKTVDINSLKIIADDKQRIVFIPETKAAILKSTIQCLCDFKTQK